MSTMQFSLRILGADKVLCEHLSNNYGRQKHHIASLYIWIAVITSAETVDSFHSIKSFI